MNAEICKLIKSQNLQEMMECVYRILGNPAFVVDMSSNIVCYTNVEVESDNWKKIVLQRELDRNFFNGGIHLRAEHAKVFRSSEALLLENTYNGEDQIKKSLHSEGKTLGILIVLPYHKPFTQEDLSNVDMVGEMIAYKMISHHGMVYGENVGSNRFLLSLLEGEPYSEEQLEVKLSQMFGNIKKYWYVCVIKGCEEKKMKLEEDIWDLFSELEFGNAFIYDTNIVLLINCESRTRDFVHYESEIVKICKENRLMLGVSMAFEQITDIRSYYSQAVRAVDLGIMLCKKETVVMFQDLVAFDIISRIQQEEMDMYVHPDIWNLKRYDDKNGTNLCETLLTYLDCNRSHRKTSELLYIHRNTVNYRINQCKEILESELRNDTELFAYTMSLLILKYKKTFL